MEYLKFLNIATIDKIRKLLSNKGDSSPSATPI